MNTVQETKEARLVKLEKQIAEGIGSVGIAIREIQEKRLYSATVHPTFEKYCSCVWGFGKSRVYQLIEAEKVKERLSAIANFSGGNSQLREIAKIPEKKQAQEVAAVLEKCEEEGRAPTAKDYRRRARAYTATKMPEKPAPEPEPDPDQWKIQRSKATKTAEALMRALDDLQRLKRMPAIHEQALAATKKILGWLKTWK